MELNSTIRSTQALEGIQVHFILFNERSGSTLLRTMLNIHPTTLSTTEAPFIAFLMNKYAGIHLLNPKQQKQFYADLLVEDKIKNEWIFTDALKTFFDQSNSKISFTNLLKIIYLSKATAFDKNIQTIVDKNPINSLFVEKIASIFPTAKFIHLVRDPRATVLSNVKKFPNKSILYQSLKWKRYNQEIERIKQKFPEKFHTLFYENLVIEPEKELRKVCNMLSIDFHAEMLEVEPRFKDVIFEYLTETQIEEFKRDKADLMLPTHTQSIHKWEKELSPKEVQLIETVCAPLINLYGYQHHSLSSTAINFFKKQQSLFILYSIRNYYKTPISIRKIIKAIRKK